MIFVNRTFLHTTGQKISKLCPEPDTNIGLLTGTPVQVSVSFSGCFAQFHPQRIKAWNEVVTKDVTRSLHPVQFSVILGNFEMSEEKRKKEKCLLRSS